MSDIIKMVEEYKNPYPKDIFMWDNPDGMVIVRGRFNEFIHETVENTRKDIIRIIRDEQGEK